MTPGVADFDTLFEDDDDDRGYIQVKDVSWVANGGTLPASGNGARYAVLLDDDVDVAAREVLAYWDLSSARVVSEGQTFLLENCEIRLNEN